MEGRKKRFTLDLDPLLQRRMKVVAALKGISMRQFCVAAIEKELARDDAEGARSLPFGEEALDKLAFHQAEVFRGRQVEQESTELIRQARMARTKGQ